MLSKLPPPITAPQADIFILFSKLPPELRLRIWALAIPDPRVITIEVASDPTGPCSGRFPFFSKTACFPTCYHPGVLSACTESRRIAQKAYDLKYCLHPRYLVPFDTSRDIVFMDVNTLSAFLKPRFWKCPSDNLEKIGIRRLALGPLRTELSNLGKDNIDEEPVTFEDLLAVLRRAIRIFKTLEEIVFCWVGDGGLNVMFGLETLMKEDARKVREWVEARPESKLAKDLKAAKVPRIVSLRFGAWEDLNGIRDKLAPRKMLLEGS